MFVASYIRSAPLLDAAVEAGKCPKKCTCDGAKLTVACVGKNLTECESPRCLIFVLRPIAPDHLKLDLRGNHLHMRAAGRIPPRRLPDAPRPAALRIVHVKEEGAFRTLGRVVVSHTAYNNIDICTETPRVLTAPDPAPPPWPGPPGPSPQKDSSGLLVLWAVALLGSS
ncbi:unnamed protein product [Arctogadus glacialis]